MDGNAQKETCRAPAPGPDGFVPARPRVVLALAVLVLAGMAGFCLALYHSLTAVRPVDPADYPGAAPEGFRWEAAVSREDGRAVFTGWACVEGEPFPDVDIRVVLYHAEDGAYYSIPTQMTPDEAATAAVADGRGYALGGFTAVVPERVAVNTPAFRSAFSAAPAGTQNTVTHIAAAQIHASTFFMLKPSFIPPFYTRSNPKTTTNSLQNLTEILRIVSDP